jgi:homogentisate 1,2-dioxygenase
MRSYMRLGEVPRKRHMRVERDGRPVFEELFGREGFSGPSSLLYHLGMPEAVHDVAPGPDDTAEREQQQVHGHAHLEAWRLGPEGDAVSGRRWLLVNDDVRIGVAVPAHAQQTLYVNASADEVLFLHHGAGTLHSQFGRLPLREGDYAVVPRGTIHRLELDDPTASRLLVVECAGIVDSPDRYRARNGQLTEFAPYSERDVRAPVELESGEGPAEVWMKRGGRVTRYCLDQHPFDVVGWDGTVYPCALSVHDFEPRAGRFHVPPPIHQVFQAPNLVICNFVPRKVDWDPEAVALPYHHSNLDSDEVMYYAAGNYSARRGIQEGSITLHVGGVPHGPQPGALEASREAPRETDELAVMIDTFRPLHRTATARQVLDSRYPYSWHRESPRS